jgi:hypothetical protein
LITESKKVNLKLDWASHAAAEYACKNWHYSKSMPCGKIVKIGVWENGKFIGVVLFGRGANNHIAMPYDLEQTECVELVRVALTEHLSAVTRIIAIAIRILKIYMPKLRLLVSMADPEQNHHGGIYQGGGWVYVGTTKPAREMIVSGKIMHGRTATSLFGTTKGLKQTKAHYKHKYLFPLDREMKKKITYLKKPYPKRHKQAMTSAQEEQRRCDTDHDAPLLLTHAR